MIITRATSRSRWSIPRRARCGKVDWNTSQEKHGDFYEALHGQKGGVGIEAIGNWQWFEGMLAEQGHELWIGDAAQIPRLVVRQQKTDRGDARHILDLLLEGRFPRIWVPSTEI